MRIYFRKPPLTTCGYPATGKHRVIALTNNFAKIDIPTAELEFLGWGEGVIPDHLRDLFDDFCDSSALGMRSGFG